MDIWISKMMAMFLTFLQMLVFYVISCVISNMGTAEQDLHISTHSVQVYQVECAPLLGF
jgi:hypothetical protein